jgi:TonB family protein
MSGKEFPKHVGLGARTQLSITVFAWNWACCLAGLVCILGEFARHFHIYTYEAAYLALSKPPKNIHRLFVCLCMTCVPLFAQEKEQSPGNAQSTAVPVDKAAPGPVGATTVTPIQGLIRAADQAVKVRDYSTCAQLLEKVVSIDPNYKNAWNYLGWTYNALGQYDKAEVALRKAIGVDPRDPRAYNNLGQALTNEKKYDEAIPQYLKQIEINPKDPWAHSNLGRAYTLAKQYDKAITELETAATLSPDDPSIPYNMGRAYAKLNEPDKAAKAFEKSEQLQPVPFRWNAVAYEMALEKLDLQQAEKYSRSAIAATVLKMRDTSLDHLTREDTSQASRIAAYWDTWGWIRFQENDLAEAEEYVKCAWLIHSLSVNGDHLGQIYEKQGRKAEAIRMYQMTLAADSSATETRERLVALAGPDANIDALIEEGHGLLKESRSITVQNTHQLEGFAEFWILLSPGPTVRGVKFISGDEELAPFAKDLERVSFPNTFPNATELRLLRRGRLACTHSSPDCHLLMIPSLNVPNEDLAVATPSVAGDVGRVRMGGNVASAKLVKRVQPAYPIAARQAGIQGIVRLHAIIGKEGSVMQLEVMSGHPLLVEAALDAVRQWIYQPTLLEGKPVEVDTTIDVIFQLTPRN